MSESPPLEVLQQLSTSCAAPTYTPGMKSQGVSGPKVALIVVLALLATAIAAAAVIAGIVESNKKPAKAAATVSKTTTKAKAPAVVPPRFANTRAYSRSAAYIDSHGSSAGTGTNRPASRGNNPRAGASFSCPDTCPSGMSYGFRHRTIDVGDVRHGDVKLISYSSHRDRPRHSDKQHILTYRRR